MALPGWPPALAPGAAPFSLALQVAVRLATIAATGDALKSAKSSLILGQEASLRAKSLYVCLHEASPTKESPSNAHQTPPDQWQA